MRATLRGFCLWVALLCSACGGYSFQNFNGTPVAASEPTAPDDAAILVAGHGGPEDAVNILLFTEEGTPLAILPHDAQSHIRLSPGHHRIFIAWGTRHVDTWDLDVVAGRTYRGLIYAGPGWYADKITPSHPRWEQAQVFFRHAEVVQLDASRSEEANLDLERAGRAELVRRGNQRMEGFSASDRELHTFRADDSL